jgi:molybdopterin-binding protein
MKLSARNAATGIVTSVEKGNVAAVVKVRVKGPITFTSLITKEAVDELKLKKGDSVAVLVKATEVIIAKE